jgi:hypothetical protein
LYKHASNADYSLIGGDRVEITIANRASGGNHPIEGVNVDLRRGRILEISQTQPVLRLIWIIVLGNCVHNTRDPMSSKYHYSGYLKEFHHQVSHFTDEEYFESSH